ncbi:murein biosynthesis integral membrane protein MurJ, partial [Burkholderia multivorans]
DYTNRLLTLSFLLLAIVSVVATLAAPILVWLYSSGWSPEQMALATAFAYWCLPQLFFYGLYTLLGQVLNAKSSFGPYMWAPVLNNIVAIAGLLVFIVVFGTNTASPHTLDTWTPEKIALMGGSATLGVAAQALILIWPLKRIGFRYRPT